ncbi:MAG: uracil-DNA glycosylase, partial [Mycobacterium sp.]|nr:uracil-DNA glycosylase [Mycobacterium sp.]
MAARPLSEIVEPGWARALEPVADQVTAMGEFLR